MIVAPLNNSLNGSFKRFITFFCEENHLVDINQTQRLKMKSNTFLKSTERVKTFSLTNFKTYDYKFKKINKK